MSDEGHGARDYGTGAPPIPVAPTVLALPRLLMVILVLLAALLVGVPVVLGLWLLANTLAAPVLAEFLQQDGALDVAPFAVGFWFSQIVLAITLIWTAERAWRRRRTGRPRWPWLPFWVLMVGMLGLALLPRLMPEISAIVGLVFLGGLLWVLPLAGLSAVVWGVGALIRGAWKREQRLLGLLPALLAVDLTAGALWIGLVQVGRHIEVDGMVADHPKGVIEALRLGSGWLAMSLDAPGPEPAVPGVHYSGSGPIRERETTAPVAVESCYRTLTIERGQRLGGRTAAQKCAANLREFPAAEQEAAALADKICSRAERRDPISYYLASCDKRLVDLARIHNRNVPIEDGFELPAPAGNNPELRTAQREVLRCVEGAMVQLTPNQQNAFRLFIDDLDYPEIAAQLGVTYDNARQLVSRSRKYLREACGSLY